MISETRRRTTSLKILTALCLVSVLQVSLAARTDEWRAITLLTESIRTPATLTANDRQEKARELAALIRRKAGKPAPEKLITDLAGLMSDSDQLVRFWVAVSLGYLGPQAAAAIPALEKALEQARIEDPPDRTRTGIHLDDGIQQALEKIRRRKKR
jgi:hypothetical protein